MKIYGLLVFVFGISAIQGLEKFQLDLIFKFDGANDVNRICQNDSIWYNRSTAESHVQRFLQAILNNSAARVSVDNVGYQTEPGYWDINCANISVTNVTNVAVLEVNLTTSLSATKKDVENILNNFWNGGWNYSLVSSIIGNKSHWIACGQARDTENTTKEPGGLHPLDCENSSPIYTPNTVDSSTINHDSSSTQSISQYSLSTSLSTGTRVSSTQHTPSNIRPSTSDSQSTTETTGYTSRIHDSTISTHTSLQSQDSSHNTGYISSSTVHYGSPNQSSLGQPDSSSTQEQQKKDDPSNALAVGLGTGLGILALLVTLATILYRYFSEKNKVSDFSSIYGFPPETPRQSDRTGKSKFRQNIA